MKIFKRVVTGLLVLVAVLVAVFLVLPKGPRDLMEFEDLNKVSRPSVESDRFMASTGTPWATEAALDILRQGGNAFDAGMAALLALNVTYPEAASFTSVAPTIIYDAKKSETVSYKGVGTAPARATIAFFKAEGYDTIPEMGILAQLIPSSPDAIVAILDRYGTFTFGRIARSAIELADKGFPTHRMMMNHLDLGLVERLGFSILMPYNVDVFLRGEWWRPLHHKDRFIEPDLARTLRKLAQAEKKVLDAGGSRSEGLQAVRDYFYKGPIAEAIVDMHKEQDGLIGRADLAGFKGKWEKPLTGSYGDYVIHTNQTWNQGAVLPMALQFLEGIDLKAMGHNSPAYVHTLIQAVDLAMADREAYFGDPDFVSVPIAGLLSKPYAARRRKMMTPGRAFGRMPDPGKPEGISISGAGSPQHRFDVAVLENRWGKSRSLFQKLDTSYLAVTDQWGNSISLTPSDFPQSPMVPGTGICLGIRMTQFRLDPEHPAALVPGKSPRITPNAVMVTRGGDLFMTIGTPEGDQQPQALLQVLLNYMVFGMDIQEAIEKPRFRSRNFPDSFSPHQYRPGVVQLEKTLFENIGPSLEKMGYIVEPTEDLFYEMGAVGAIIRNPETGHLTGGADPRQENWAAGG